MGSKTRRLLCSIAVVAAAPLLTILTPGTAHAGTCYTVQVGTQWFTVCP